MKNILGFRRTRIIKRKIIWDPDAPETTFSYAKLVTSSKPKVKQEPTIPTTTITKGSTTIRPIKKDTPTNITNTKKTQRPVTPRERKLEIDTSSAAKKFVANQKQQECSTAAIKKEVEPDRKKSLDSVSTSSSPVADISPSNKRRSQTPVANGPGGAKKKKISEIDRLMGDEGAVNMLNSLEKLGVSETKSTRPMMRSRAATICEKVRMSTLLFLKIIFSNFFLAFRYLVRNPPRQSRLLPLQQINKALKVVNEPLNHVLHRVGIMCTNKSNRILTIQ